MNKKYDDQLVSLLCQIATKSAMSDILDNLLTPGEREEIALRLQIFEGLIKGESQRELAKKLGVSLATISRGSRELRYGRQGIVKALRNG